VPACKIVARAVAPGAVQRKRLTGHTHVLRTSFVRHHHSASHRCQFSLRQVLAPQGQPILPQSCAWHPASYTSQTSNGQPSAGEVASFGPPMERNPPTMTGKLTKGQEKCRSVSPFRQPARAVEAGFRPTIMHTYHNAAE
jgi:hypothetical protein